MKTGSRSSYSTLYLSENTLEIVHIILCSVMILTCIDNVARKRSLAQSEERTLEDIMTAILIIEETEGTATAGGIVDNLGNHLVDIIEEKLVADTDLAGRLYQYVPKAHLWIELAEQEHLYLGIGLLLGTVKTGWENLGIVEDEGIALFKEIHDILELQEYWIAIGINHILAVFIFLVHLDGFTLLVENHESGLVAASNLECTFTTSRFYHVLCLMWIKCHLIFWQLKVKL